MDHTTIHDCKLIDLPKFLDRRGNLSVVEELQHIPFEIKRVFWIYDVPGDSQRGEHAYRNTEEFIIALSGSFDVVLEDKNGHKQLFHLNRSYYGVYVPKMIWRRMENFSTNSLALVVTNTEYDSHDYIRDYKEFKLL